MGPKIPESTKVLTDSTLTELHYVSSVGDTLVFSGAAHQIASLDSGDVIVSGEGTGLLRKVEQIINENDQLTILSRQATLQDAFEDATIDFQRQLTVNDLEPGVNLPHGMKLSANPENFLEFSFEVDRVILYDADGDLGTESDQVTIDGEFSFELHPVFRVKIQDAELQECLFTLTTNETASLGLTSSVALPEIQTKVAVGPTLRFKPIVIWVGPVPVVITPVVRVVVGCDGSIAVGFETGITQSSHVEVGLAYQNGSWNSTREFSNDFDYLPPATTAECRVKGYVGPELDLLIYSVIGPYVLLDGYVEVDITPQATPRWSLYGGLEASAGVMIGILDIEYEFGELIDFRQLLASAPPGDGVVGHWDFGQGSGSVLEDTSGNGNHGTIKGPSWVEDPAGYEGFALEFDGRDDWVEVLETTDLDGFTRFTVEAIIYPRDVGIPIISKETAGEPSRSYNLHIDSGESQTFGFMINLNGQDNPHVTTPPGMAIPGSWYHLAATFDGTTERLYVDYDEVATLQRSGSVNNSQAHLSIGKNWQGDRFFNGYLVALRISEDVLEPRQFLPWPWAIAIEPDGTGAFPTIQDAVAAAADGDIIELANGTFTGPGNRDISYGGRAITIRARSADPRATVIDCQGLGRAFLFDDGEGPESVLQGVTITNGRARYGGAVYIWHSNPTLKDCLFTSNVAFGEETSYGGGAIHCSVASPHIERCCFLENSGEDGGALFSSSSSHPTIMQCTFARNLSNRRGALWCVAPVSITSSTFFGNEAPIGSAIAGPAQVTHSLICFGSGGSATWGGLTLTCCDIYGNAGGDWVGSIEGQYGNAGNISQNPLFCNPEAGDFHLQATSPCVPEASECGLMGAWTAGCE